MLCLTHLKTHMKFRQVVRRNPYKKLLHLISLPFIYGMIVPFIFLDLCLEVYHRVCFPLYGLKTFRRSRYIKIDRHKLQYLKPLERIHCLYCGYANGLLHYASVIAAETEGYWCGIKHKKTAEFHEPLHHDHFLEYGNKAEFNDFVKR